MSRIVRWGSLGLVALLAVGCATGRAVRQGHDAALAGDWDTAVAYYRQALTQDPSRLDVRIQLERATRNASAEHMKRARELEEQEQLPGAMAEFRLAADLDPTNGLARAKVAELERRIREQIDASRAPPRIDTMRQQAGSPIPRLDPRVPVPSMRMPNPALRDLLKTIGDLTGIVITYDQGLDATLSRGYPIDIQETPLQDVLSQVLAANQLTYKVINARTIFIYQDSPTQRQKWEDQYTQTFYISNADPNDLNQVIQQMTQQGPAVRPVVFLNKSANALVVRATAPVMEVIARLIEANDKPRPEVMIEAEILEVNRNFVRQLGIDFSQWALGFTFSPEVAPPNTPSLGQFPTAPPPFNLNTLSQGVSAADFYLTTPTALVNLLESNSKTKVLARPQLRGRDGGQMQLRLGDLVPIPQTVFNSAAAGGIANVPTTSVNYQSVGVNLIFTPRVTYQDEIILENLQLEKSGLGANIAVGGQVFPTIISRSATASVRLRDGESNLLAGLLSDQERETIKSFPGLTGLPILRSIFGNSDNQVDQTDIVMIITPRILRSHELKPSDLRPMYIGTGQNFGAGSAPPLISPDAPIGGTGGAAPPQPLVGPPAAAAGAAAPPPPVAGAQPPATTLPPATPPPAAPPAAPRAPGVVPIQAVPPPGGQPATPAPTTGQPRIFITMPAGADGLAAGGGPYTAPISIAGADNISTMSISITYDPNLMKPLSVTPGTFMNQGGATATFVPRIDAAAGRIDIAISRPAAQGGATGTGLIASVTFQAGGAGSGQVAMTGVATATTGQPVPLVFTGAAVIVK